jgi:hypothetical protein
MGAWMETKQLSFNLVLFSNERRVRPPIANARCHPERSAAKSKDPAEVTLKLRNGIPRLRSG